MKAKYLLLLALAGNASAETMIASVNLREAAQPETVVTAAADWEARGAKTTMIFESNRQGLFGLDIEKMTDYQQAVDLFVKERKRVPYKTLPPTITHVWAEGEERDLMALELDPLIQSVSILAPKEKEPEPPLDPGTYEPSPFGVLQ